MFLYNFMIHVYQFFIRIFSLFNTKAKKWIEGRSGIFNKIEVEIKHDKPIAWFHCASLGEFEQGRPVIEAFRKYFPDYRILLTFFSPSGYEIRKNFPGADYIYYLPSDTSSNAKRFLNITRPKIAFFIKYEYWFNYILQLKKSGIPVIGVASIFRPGQRFFRWYGKWQLQMLKTFSHFFVQNKTSAELLKSAGIDQVTVSGDTRFDRVFEVAQQKKTFPVIEHFRGESQLFIAGSTWPPDEALIIELIKQKKENLKFIIAPHEVHKERIDSLMAKLPTGSLRFSQATEANISSATTLVIDNIGILSHLYQYAALAYIGGGFGVGIHNILEAATFGNPVIFGPNYLKFQEARELIELEGAFSIKSKTEFLEIADKLLTNPEFLLACSGICRNYVNDQRGATQLIMDYVSQNLIS
ncbi:MAG: 3-deoxy-D-manno-octulosonic acid transferase [Bacteroidales bacterium]|nr:3-deoxy-D-manno-octulosonic acid transferase [Bacteroidales bacterium]